MNKVDVCLALRILSTDDVEAIRNYADHILATRHVALQRMADACADFFTTLGNKGALDDQERDIVKRAYAVLPASARKQEKELLP